MQWNVLEEIQKISFKISHIWLFIYCGQRVYLSPFWVLDLFLTIDIVGGNDIFFCFLWKHKMNKYYYSNTMLGLWYDSNYYWIIWNHKLKICKIYIPICIYLCTYKYISKYLRNFAITTYSVKCYLRNSASKGCAKKAYKPRFVWNNTTTATGNR